MFENPINTKYKTRRVDTHKRTIRENKLSDLTLLTNIKYIVNSFYMKKLPKFKRK